MPLQRKRLFANTPTANYSNFCDMDLPPCRYIEQYFSTTVVMYTQQCDIHYFYQGIIQYISTANFVTIVDVYIYCQQVVVIVGRMHTIDAKKKVEQYEGRSV
jgi:hypothetical protein